MKTAAVYYSDNSISERLRSVCMQQLMTALPPGVELVRILQSSRAIRGHVNLFINILCGISQTDADIIFLVEHDVLYPEGYFSTNGEQAKCDFIYTKPGFFLDENGYYPRHGFPLSSLSACREQLVEFCQRQLHTLLSGEPILWAEPYAGDYHIKVRHLDRAFIDIRHRANFTGDRHAKTIFQQIDYWPTAAVMWSKIKEEV